MHARILVLLALLVAALIATLIAASLGQDSAGAQGIGPGTPSRTPTPRPSLTRTPTPIATGAATPAAAQKPLAPVAQKPAAPRVQAPIVRVALPNTGTGAALAAGATWPIALLSVIGLFGTAGVLRLRRMVRD